MTYESWRDGSVVQRNLHTLNSESMADCTFLVGADKKKKFQCHKYVLCHASPVFYAMFNGELREKGDVKVEDIEPQPFRKMLEYIYSDNTNLETAETALSVCYAANKYMINKLTLKCIDFIRENMNADIVIRTLDLAYLIDNADLKTECLQYLNTNASDVLKSSSFPNVEKATLLTILSQDNICIKSEVELYSACIRWAEAQQRGDNVSLREVLGPDVLSLIRFLTMTAQEFATVVIPSKPLHSQEGLDVLCRLITGAGDMPQGFNTNMQSRFAIGPREIIKIRDKVYGNCRGDTINRESHFCFSVNVDCYIYGLQLHGISREIRTFQDSFEIKFLHSSELIASINFGGKISPGKTVEINFQKPVHIQAYKDYKLQIEYSNLSTPYEAHYLDGDGTTYNTTTGVKMSVSYVLTTISQIYIAKKVK